MQGYLEGFFHRSVILLQKLEKWTIRLGRWLFKLQQYDFDIWISKRESQSRIRFPDNQRYATQRLLQNADGINAFLRELKTDQPNFQTSAYRTDDYSARLRFQRNRSNWAMETMPKNAIPWRSYSWTPGMTKIIVQMARLYG